jgi:serine/threonine protein kinase
LTGETLTLAQEWLVGEQIGKGGFGHVYAARSTDGQDAAVKFVPKAPGADREMLFVNLADAPNVVPIIDSGEHNENWVLVMPRAEISLREQLDEADEFDIEGILDVLRDVAEALVALDGHVVHRDLKPQNILRLEGRWCLADFGISRYAEATTAPDTQKFAMSPPYAAPERWRNERATSATDVYAVGVMAFEMIAGERPFPGPSIDQYREAHLHADPPRLNQVPAALGALVDECLYKAPEARPRPANLRARLDRAAEPSASAGLARLQESNRADVVRRSTAARRESEARTEAERRQELLSGAQRSFAAISQTLLDAIEGAAPSASASQRSTTGWTLRLNNAELSMSSVGQSGSWGHVPPTFDVIAVATLSLKIPPDQYQYEGRSHSLWFGDIQQAGSYQWYETAFMFMPLMAQRGRQDPFALDPGEEAARAVGYGLADLQVAWPFTPLVVGELDAFIDRWAGWFAEAADGKLSHPGGMPERPPQGSWRTG